MFGKSKRSALADRGEAVSDLAGRTVVVAGHAAERAASAAREARKAASPVVRKGAHTAAGALSDAAERAAEVLAETADRLASSDTSTSARERLADRAEALAAAVRPKKKHRVRKVLFLGAIAGGVVAVVKSPLKTKLANKLFGEPATDDDLDAITLPVDEAPDGEASSAEEAPRAVRGNHSHSHKSDAETHKPDDESPSAN